MKAKLDERAKSLLLLALILFLSDFALKLYVNNSLPKVGVLHPVYPFGGIAVFKGFAGIDFSIVHATNKGAAWGLFAHFQSMLMALRFVVAGGITVYTLFWNNEKPRQIPLTLILAGAYANILDFFVYGHVVDMFNFKLWGYSYPVFNLADSYIFLGVVALLWQAFITKKSTSSA